MARMLASLATPEKLDPFPAAIPATWVPWLHPDMLVEQLSAELGPI